ncbi:uncharacterized protein Z518_04399 [Rhinocladiella mackenziei CBS 650.93]|uniref:DUF6589 domain-containing protein n=1 Tax=Rhinocladiella mackenziei CBS 650.93 TaxID=1442369 RepID=A0A0D2H7Q3_9EURO|nr:uncharacterized protein Z518_04399 [Rhinocladiella mackenziei CBS 650.93]KIX06423.1 hypothetical protein Z518_04399 [Rhinocladiella mackenziei CBS 650.93]
MSAPTEFQNINSDGPLSSIPPSSPPEIAINKRLRRDSTSPAFRPQPTTRPQRSPILCARCAACPTCRGRRQRSGSPPQDSQADPQHELSRDSTDENGTDEPRPQPRRRVRISARAAPISPAQKIEMTYNTYWQKWRWGIGEFVQHSYNCRDLDSAHRRRWQRFRRWLAESSASLQIWEDLPPAQRELMFQAFGGWDYVMQCLDKELCALECLDAFGSWNIHRKEQLADMIVGVGQQTIETAPKFGAMLHGLVINQRTAKESKRPTKKNEKEEERAAAKVATIAAIILFSRHSNSNNNIPVNVGLHCLDAGVGKRTISILQGMGLCPSFATLKNKEEVLRSAAAAEIRRVGQGPHRIYGAWDNFEFKDHRQHERIGDASTFRSTTTAVICIGDDHEEPTLLHDMWRQNQPIKPTTIVKNMIAGDALRDIQMFFLRRAFQNVFPQLVSECIYKGGDLPKILSTQLIRPAATITLPLRAILVNESTNENTIKIIDDIFLNQLGFESDSEVWKQELRCMIGDVKTINRMQSGSQNDETSPLQDNSTLQFACDQLGRAKASNGKIFEELAQDMFDAKIIALAIFKEWLKSLDVMAFELLINKLYTMIFKTDLTIQGRHHDDQYSNNLYFIRHMMTYQLLDYSVHHGDLYLLREALRQCCIIFQAPSARKGNYAREVIRFLDLIDGEATDAVLSDAILKSALVNIKGGRGSFYPTDKHLEHINLAIRNGLADQRSSFDKTAWIQNRILNIPFRQQLRDVFSREFGKISSEHHTKKDAGQDVFHFAARLASNFMKKKDDRVAFEVVDLEYEGRRAYPDAVLRYNIRSGHNWNTTDAEDSS